MQRWCKKMVDARSDGARSLGVKGLKCKGQFGQLRKACEGVDQWHEMAQRKREGGQNVYRDDRYLDGKSDKQFEEYSTIC